MDRDKAPATSAQVPDWIRERKAFFSWHPSRSLLASIRAYQRHATSSNPFHVIGRQIAVVRHRLRGIVTGADIPIRTQSGSGHGSNDQLSLLRIAVTAIQDPVCALAWRY